MQTIAELVSEYLAHNEVQLLNDDEIERLCIKAAKFYAGYAELIAHKNESHLHLPPPQAIDSETCLDNSEWVIIEPLFTLYVERNTAFQLEISGNMGVSLSGKTSSEISSEIKTMQDELPKKAFSSDIYTIK